MTSTAIHISMGAPNGSADRNCIPKKRTPFAERCVNVPETSIDESLHKDRKTGVEPPRPSTPGKVKIGISGGGPRAMNHIISLVALMCINETKLTELRSQGIDFCIEVVVFEKQSKKRGAGGNAFQPECDATLNTGIPGRMNIPGLQKIAKTHPIVYAATDLAKTVAHMVERDPQKLLKRYKTKNLAAYSVLKNALRPDGTLDTSVPCLSRDVLGAGLTKNVNDVIAYANDVLPFIDIKICYNQQVIDVDFSDPKKPTLIVDGKDDPPKRHEFDMVFLATGTALKSRVQNSIAHKTYSQIPNYSSLNLFFRSLGLVENQYDLKQGTKLGITGASLSAYDYICILATQLGIVVPSTTNIGYKIDLEVAAKYQGLITLISPTAGRITPPAISSAPSGLPAAAPPSWPVGLPDGIGICDEIHSTFLQKNFEAFPLFQDLAKANIARALGTIPGKVNEPMSTKARLADYQRQIDDFLTGRKPTEWAFWKTSYLQLISGIGFHHDSGAARKRLSALAPLTHSPFSVVRKYRAHTSAFTNPDYVKKTTNAKAAKVQNEVIRLLGPSPIGSQQIVNLLSESGVLNHASGKSEHLRISDDGQFVELDDLQFHAILSPKAMVRETNIILEPLMRYVRQVAPGQPEYAKGRLLVAQDGRPLNVYECGTIGQGARVRNADGTFSCVGMRWPDTHGYANLIELVCQAPYLTLSFALLKSVGVSNPISHMQEHYRTSLPDSQVFDRETAKFEGAFLEILRKIAFLNLCKVLAGNDGALYREFTDKVYTHEDRAAFVKGLKVKQLSQTEEKALAAYQHQTTNPVKYEPVSVEEFGDRFVDFTEEELDGMLNKAISVANSCTGCEARN